MKINVIIALIIGLFIITSMCMSCSRVMPYSENSLFSKNYPYEGFSELEYTTNADHKPMDSVSPNIASAAPMECAKVYGFDGLYCKPYVADNKIDVFSGVVGKPSCTGSSSGLSNSMGGLCLDESQKQLLKTRGGNATGADSKIGK